MLLEMSPNRKNSNNEEKLNKKLVVLVYFGKNIYDEIGKYNFILLKCLNNVLFIITF